MEKSHKRALRRHHIERIKKRRAVYSRHDPVVRPMSDRELGMVAHTAAMCSCWMCGNERKFFGFVTMPEKRHVDIMHDGILELEQGE